MYKLLNDAYVELEELAKENKITLNKSKEQFFEEMEGMPFEFTMIINDLIVDNFREIYANDFLINLRGKIYNQIRHNFWVNSLNGENFSLHFKVLEDAFKSEDEDFSEIITYIENLNKILKTSIKKDNIDTDVYITLKNHVVSKLFDLNSFFNNDYFDMKENHHKLFAKILLEHIMVLKEEGIIEKDKDDIYSYHLHKWVGILYISKNFESIKELIKESKIEIEYYEQDKLSGLFEPISGNQEFECKINTNIFRKYQQNQIALNIDEGINKLIKIIGRSNHMYHLIKDIRLIDDENDLENKKVKIKFAENINEEIKEKVLSYTEQLIKEIINSVHSKNKIIDDDELNKKFREIAMLENLYKQEVSAVANNRKSKI